MQPGHIPLYGPMGSTGTYLITVIAVRLQGGDQSSYFAVLLVPNTGRCAEPDEL
jgi:hypothetical protein